MPSWPEMPTPTSAICIMDTSLAPSPIARVRKLSSSLTTLTKYAFCSGVERQQSTEAQPLASLRNGRISFDLRKYVFSLRLICYYYVLDNLLGIKYESKCFAIHYQSAWLAARCQTVARRGCCLGIAQVCQEEINSSLGSISGTCS